MILFRQPVLKFGQAGVLPANFAALGTSASPLVNDAVLPADADTEWLWVLLSPLPGSGTTLVNDRGGYALVSPADGIWTQAYRALTMPPTGSVGVYESSITTTVGSGDGSSLVASIAATDLVVYAGAVSVVAVISGGSETPAISGAPVIEIAPSAITVTEGSTASFTVVADGVGTLTYTWLIDGVAYPGVDETTLSFMATMLHDGVMVSVRVSDGVGSTTSDAVLLTVTEAVGAPTAAESRQMYRWITELASLHGLMLAMPLEVAQARRRAGLLEQSIATTGSTTTVTRL